MTVLWFLQRPEHSLGKPAVFVSLASCYVVVDEVVFCFFSVRPSDFCLLSDFVSLSLLPTTWVLTAFCKNIGRYTYTGRCLQLTVSHSGFRLPRHFPPTCLHTRQADRSDWRGVCVQIRELNHNCMGFLGSSSGSPRSCPWPTARRFTSPWRYCGNR